VELLIFKYRRQNSTVSITLILQSLVRISEVTFADRNNAPVHMVRGIEQLLTREAPDFMPTALTSTRKTTGFGGSCRSVCIAQLKSRLMEEWEHFNLVVN